MRKAPLSKHQSNDVRKSAEAGRTVKYACRKAGILLAPDYNWKAKFGCMEASDTKK